MDITEPQPRELRGFDLDVDKEPIEGVNENA